MKKLAFVIALLIMAAMLFTACDSSSDGGDTTVTTPADTTTPAEQVEETTPAPVETERTLASKDGCDYVVMRSEYGDESLTQASVDLKNALVEKFGKNAAPALKTDWDKNVARGDHIETDTYEILIGDTNRVESETVLKELSENQYAIKWVNKKLVIVGSDDYATKAAVNAFIDQCVKPAEGDALVLPLDLSISGKASIQKFELAEGADIRIMTYNIAGSTKEYADRKEHIFASIIDYLPDVIGFQEANKATHNDILRSSTIAKYYGMNKNTHGSTSTVNYTPILYLKAKYKQLEGGVEWLRSRYEGTNTKSLSWTVLERLSDGARFIVVNIHGSLWSTDYNPPSGETHATMQAKAAKEWKEDNARQILDKISEMRAKYGDIAVFTTGDYNFNSSHSAYQIMKSTGLGSSQEKAASVTKGASYHSAVGSAPSSDGLAIDHIFYDPNITEPIKHVICKRQIDLASSDHCPVYTDFKLNK